MYTSLATTTIGDMNREKMMAWIEKNLKTDGSMHIDTTEAFFGEGLCSGGIWLSAEENAEYKGKVVYDYYSEDYEKRSCGVLKTWEEQLAKRGWYSEWNDSGTVMIYEI